MRALLAGLVVAGPLLAGDPAWLKAHEAWRQARLATLRQEDGWLSVVGLHWLSPGENAFGSEPGLPVTLAGPGVPRRAGVFLLTERGVEVRPEPGADLRLDGHPLTAPAALRADVDGRPQVLRLGGLSCFVLRRGDRYGIRVKDPEAPARRAFKGIPAFPPDPAYRVVATWEAYPQPRPVKIATVIGTTEVLMAPGRVRFTLHGKPCVLEPVLEDPEHPELFFVFRDATSGRTTYPAGRFLYAAMPEAGKVVLDFNRATNPPCAFTPFATCPMARPENGLKVAVRAGEKAVAH